MLTIRPQGFRTAQAGTPMAVTGEDSLPPWMGAGRLSHFICSKISSGGGAAERGAVGGRRPPFFACPFAVGQP